MEQAGVARKLTRAWFAGDQDGEEHYPAQVDGGTLFAITGS